jgi:mRNA interferase MazF
MVVDQYQIFLINLNPTIGNEIKKTRPCLVISPNEMNKYIATVIIAPMTTKSRDYPSRVPVTFQERQAWIVLDQIRTVDKRRLIKRIGKIDARAIARVKTVLSEMLVE